MGPLIGDCEDCTLIAAFVFELLQRQEVAGLGKLSEIARKCDFIPLICSTRGYPVEQQEAVVSYARELDSCRGGHHGAVLHSTWLLAHKDFLDKTMQGQACPHAIYCESTLPARWSTKSASPLLRHGMLHYSPSANSRVSEMAFPYMLDARTMLSNNYVRSTVCMFSSRLWENAGVATFQLVDQQQQPVTVAKLTIGAGAVSLLPLVVRADSPHKVAFPHTTVEFDLMAYMDERVPWTVPSLHQPDLDLCGGAPEAMGWMVDPSADESEASRHRVKLEAVIRQAGMVPRHVRFTHRDGVEFSMISAH
jgi:hypothetical protein